MSEYHESKEDLEHRQHPITWLRVRLLADRARRMDCYGDAEALEHAWDMIAGMKNIAEEYYGFYDSGFLPAIQKMIDDMLIEASPRGFAEQEVAGSEIDSPSFSPVHLLNQAWQRFWDDAENYRTWEERAIRDFLQSEI